MTNENGKLKKDETNLRELKRLAQKLLSGIEKPEEVISLNSREATFIYNLVAMLCLSMTEHEYDFMNAME